MTMQTQNQNLLDVLTREGVLINVSVRYWRAAKKLNPQDLGLDPDDVTDRLISLGHKRLVPKDALAALALIESRAHAIVESATFPFLNGFARFLPNRKLTEVTERLDALKIEFDTEHRKFLLQYADLRENALDEWRAHARRLSPNPERIVTSINAAYPTSDKLTAKFGFSTNTFQIRLLENLDAEFIQASDRQEVMLAREQAAQVARERISEGVEGFVGDCVASLREQTATLCDEMLESFKSGKSGVHQRTLNRLTDFIDNFKALNFANDIELEQQLNNVRETFLGKSAVEYRDNAGAQARMRQGIQKLADTARELATADTREIVDSFGRLGNRRFTLAA